MINNFSVTASAYQHLKKLTIDNNAAGVLIGLKKSGCSGYSYVIELADTVEKYANTQEVLFDDLSVFVNPKHLEAFAGMQINYTQDGLNSRLTFDNPNTHSECGCGSSFQINQK
jgi:iron-sulfur cluster assembly protein